MNFVVAPFFLVFFIILLIFAFIFKVAFKLRFPVFRSAIILIILIFLFKLIQNFVPKLQFKNFVFLEQRNLELNPKSKTYILIMGKSDLNLSDITFYKQLEKIKIINFGGKLKIKYTDYYPSEIVVKNILSHTILPMSDLNTMGSYIIKTSSLDKRRKYLNGKITTIFGNTTIRKYQ